MAIIRNERSKRTGSETVEDVELEEEIDYTWHPNEDEYVSPLTAAQWAELLGDESFAQSDAGKAVRCLREYGEPATFQQLSIRYRGTMGRYRRWLSEAAQTAGERFGVPAPQQNQYGMDEWWPLLYQTRNAGKPGAGIFEMALRPEVEEAFQQLEEEERLAKRAENARQLQRIEQLERARQEERRRAADSRTEAAPQRPEEPAAVPEQKSEPPAPQEVSQKTVQQPEQKARPASVRPGVVSVPMSRLKPSEESATEADPELVVQEQVKVDLPATRAFLRAVETSPVRGTRFVPGDAASEVGASDAAAPVDYALRYAERLRYAITLMRKATPSLTLAAIARELGDESVATLQDIINGRTIPPFSYLDALRERVLIGVERLEAPDGMEDALPAFVTLHDVAGTDGVEARLTTETPLEISYVVDDSADRRTGVILRFGVACCALLTRNAVRGAARRGDNAVLEAFIRMVDELDDYARRNDVLRTSRQVSSAEWEDLAAGRIWPGSLLR
ncbi:MAG: hypothetical protein IKF14_14595 [Atopobiaceae bacterium]|nr:hypothetical protein [Atopobiaceae bacterium]